MVTDTEKLHELERRYMRLGEYCEGLRQSLAQLQATVTAMVFENQMMRRELLKRVPRKKYRLPEWEG